MPTFRYKAVSPTGVSVFGVFDSENESALAACLQTRGLSLLQASELSLNTALSDPRQDFPRLFQLRIGDRLREALLTDMPAHVALRALADEPFEHPVLMSMPWLLMLSLFAAGLFCVTAVVMPQNMITLLLWAVFLPAAAGLIWFMTRFIFIVRPKHLLLKVAARLEAGDGDVFSKLGPLSSELRGVVTSKLDSRTKAASIAELVPAITGLQLRSHQFAVRMLGPCLAFGLLLIGVHLLMLTVVPEFARIFEDFGIQAPGLTLLVVAISRSATVLGIPGLLVTMAVIFGSLAAMYFLLVWPRTAQVWESIPVLGLSVRWLMQARVARMLSVLIRNQAPPAEAIAIASQASGFATAGAEGRRIAEMVDQGMPDLAYTRSLSGLPLSMLFHLSDRQDHERIRQETAESFQSFAVALEQASESNGAFLTILFELILVLLAGCMIGLVVLALFLPVIKLLNNLAYIAMILWWVS